MEKESDNLDQLKLYIKDLKKYDNIVEIKNLPF